MQAEVTVPGLRQDVRVFRAGEQYVVEDRIRRVRVAVDALGVAVIQALAGGRLGTAELLQEVGAEPHEVWRRVAQLNRHVLLETPRAQAQLAINLDAASTATLEEHAPTEETLLFPEGLAHGCVSSGGCCGGTDLGPLDPADVARVEAIDWSPHLPPEVTREDWFGEAVGPDGKPVVMLGRTCERCVFQRTDKLCTIHAEAGMLQKPTMCQQFPYTFTRTPAGISVSFATECRAWWQARNNGAPPREEEATLRGLLAQGASVLEAPAVVPIWDGLDWSWRTWEETYRRCVAGVRAAEDLAAMLDALVSPVLERVRAALDDFEASEPFVRPAVWGVVAGGVGAATSSDTRARELSETLVPLMDDLGERYDAVGEPGAADRYRRLSWATRSLLSGERITDLIRFEHEADIWRDMILASLHAHEPTRRGFVLGGLATLIWRVLTARQLAGLLARTGMRARTSEQDCVDSMVLLTKLPRSSALDSTLQRLRRPLVETFILDLGVFTRGDAPGLGDRRLPGDVQGLRI